MNRIKDDGILLCQFFWLDDGAIYSSERFWETSMIFLMRRYFYGLWKSYAVVFPFAKVIYSIRKQTEWLDSFIMQLIEERDSEKIRRY